jgi:polysaccharide deacetylase 2 family uncharacterized protein YibQ
MNDDLYRPLGQQPVKGKKPPRAPRRGAVAVLGLIALAGAIMAFALLPRDPYPGEPYVVARIEPAPPPPPPAAAAPANAADDPSGGETAHGARPPRTLSGEDVEQQSGVKVTRAGASTAPGALIIKVAPDATIGLPPAPDSRVAEQTKLGVLPKIGSDGAKPMEVYARPFVAPASLKPTAPRIALVVGGLGLNPAATREAIETLPEAVTLAFAPYGANLSDIANAAREKGHETLLQAPMEPFDASETPGPHTLLTSGGARDDLLWLLSRFSGYAGVMNFLGGRFTANEQALTPVLAELAGRGLFFLDDGASPQSLVTEAAKKVALPAARVDIVLDADRSPQAMDAALVRLEALARQTGTAIGFANAFPETIARLARFARDLERKGIALAPAPSALDRPASAGAPAIDEAGFALRTGAAQDGKKTKKGGSGK